MVAKRFGKVQGLDVVLAEIVSLTLADFTIYTYLGTVELALVVRVVVVCPVDGAGGIEAQPVSELDVCQSCGIQLVGSGVHIVVEVGAQGVTSLQECTCSRIVRTRAAIVILLIAVGISTDDGQSGCGVDDAHIDRIDRSNTRGVVAQVGRTQLILVVVRVADGGAVNIAYVHTDTQPIGQVVVNLQTGIEALEA